MIILVKYINDELLSIDPVEYDDLESHIRNEIQLMSYSYYNDTYNDTYNGIFQESIYIDTDYIETIENIFTEVSKDVIKWLKLYNRSNTMKNILSNEN